MLPLIFCGWNGRKGSGGGMRLLDRLEFGDYRSLRTSPQTGVAISRIEVSLLVEKFRKTVQKNGLYDDRLPEIRWRFPHQCEHWFLNDMF